MATARLITIRPPDRMGRLDVAAVGDVTGENGFAMDAAMRLLGQHFAEHATINPTFVLRDSWEQVYRRAMESGLAGGRHRLVIAVPLGASASEAVGVCASWLRTGQVSLGETGVISEVFVAASYRGKGVGRQLAEDAAHWLLLMGANELTLSTPVVGGARAFWERLGFAVTSHGMTRFPPR